MQKAEKQLEILLIDRARKCERRQPSTGEKSRGEKEAKRGICKKQQSELKAGSGLNHLLKSRRGERRTYFR